MIAKNAAHGPWHQGVGLEIRDVSRREQCNCLVLYGVAWAIYRLDQNGVLEADCTREASQHGGPVRQKGVLAVGMH